MRKFIVFKDVRTKLDALLEFMKSPIIDVENRNQIDFSSYGISPEQKHIQCYVRNKLFMDERIESAWDYLGVTDPIVPVNFIYSKYYEIIDETKAAKAEDKKRRRKVDNA